jgi:hypothetical protein
MKIVKAALTTVVFLSLSGLAVRQQAQIRSLRGEMTALRGEAAEATSLREENERLAEARPKPEPYVAHQNDRELLRLRGEVGVLRRQVAEATKLQTHVKEVESAADSQEVKPVSTNGALVEFKAKIDALKQREELLLATLKVPDQVSKSEVADAVETENVNVPQIYFQFGHAREEMQSYEADLQTKLRMEANNAGADTSGGSGK